MPRGRRITDLEKVFLRAAFINKYVEHFADIEEDVKQNSSSPFERIKGIGDSKKGELSASTWRNLFHPQAPYKPTGATLDGFYRLLFGEGRTDYCHHHPDKTVGFAIKEEPQKIQTTNKTPLSIQQDLAQIAVLQQENEDLKKELAAQNEQLRLAEQTLAAKEEQLRLTTLWYKPPPIEEESTLKNALPFLNNVEFRSRIKLLIQSLMKGYAHLGKETVKLNPRLAWYKDVEDADMPRQGVLYFKSKDNYDFGIDRVTWTSFDKGKEIEKMAHELFSGFSTTILGFQAQVGADFLNQLLAIDSAEYTAIIIYIGFMKGDITAMARYPAFVEDMRTLGGNFVLGSRPWWLNALDMERRKAFSWEDTIDSQRFTMGLSRPYQTIRRNAPNERCFWVEVPIESKDAVMIMGIDVLKND